MSSNALKRIGFYLASFALLLLFFVPPVTAADSQLSVYVVNYPLKYFAERVGGEHVKVTFPVPGDEDPAYWTPNIATIGAYQQADLILLNGAGYAKWVDKVSLPRSKTVDTSRKFRNRLITVKETTTHSHGAAGQHAHENLAFTTWIDFSLATAQARAVAAAFTRKRPRFKADFEAGYGRLAQDLADLDRHIEKTVAGHQATPLIVSHPVYDYLVQRYGLNARSVHWEPDQRPMPGQIIELEKMLADHPAKWMVWEGKPLPAAVQLLVDLGVGSVVFDPCGNVPEGGDFLEIMQQNGANLKQIFE